MDRCSTDALRASGRHGSARRPASTTPAGTGSALTTLCTVLGFPCRVARAPLYVGREPALAAGLTRLVAAELVRRAKLVRGLAALAGELCHELAVHGREAPGPARLGRVGRGCGGRLRL